MHMHTCSGRGGGGRIRGGCGATGAPVASPQQEDRGESAQGPTHPSVEQQTQGKPRCTSFLFQIMTHIYVSITCALGLGICLEP